MAAKALKAVGERGSWFAKVGDERLPCCHAHWVKGTHHNDPGYIQGVKQWDELLQAINENRKVILTKDETKPDPDKKSGMAFDRTGYIAIFEVTNIEADTDGLRFDLTKRLSDLN